jgi:enoyl-CoA hydratase/carnithine racemase
LTDSGQNANVLELPWYIDAPPIRRWVSRLESEDNRAEAERRVAAWIKMVDDHDVIKIDIKGRVGLVELAYPLKANALVPPMYKLFVDAIDKLAENDDVWVIVIRGQGNNFSSGGFVGPDAFYAGLDSGEDGTRAEPVRRTSTELFQGVPRAINRCEKPIIAMVNGPVMAEAVDIALAADLRTGHVGTEFRFSFATTGNTAYTGASWSLPRLIGLSRAKQALLTSEWIKGERAYEIGLLNFLYDTESLEAETLALAEKITGLPPVTQRLLKKELALGLDIGNYNGAMETYGMIETIVQTTEDHMDAERAVVEKRAPIVRGY